MPTGATLSRTKWLVNLRLFHVNDRRRTDDFPSRDDEPLCRRRRSIYERCALSWRLLPRVDAIPMLRTLDTSIAKMEYRTAWVIAPSNGLPIVVDYDPVAIRVRGVGALPLVGPRRPLASVLTAVCT